ncbi:diguanylate cyclase [Shewanella aestuarii]|uniref:diguanylate cyclase n=2 Tax=Shewanella aestuarii TaxID=1028752 RepID=A0A6G9QNA9_9GAMM|nr:diguanylate cyclase [Shewanella aestuarii]
MLTLVNSAQANSEALTANASTPQVNEQQTPLRLTKSSISKIDLFDWLYIQSQRNIKQLEQVKLQPNQSWRKLSKRDLQLVGASDLWLSLSIFSPTDYQTKIIALDNPLLDSAVIYHHINGQLIKTTKWGDTLPFYYRPLESNTFLYSFDLKPNEMHQFYIKVDTHGSRQLPLTLWSPNDLTQMIETKNLGYGLQIGLLVAIGLFSLFIALATHSYSYSYYTGYVLGLALLISTIHGVAFRYLWPNMPMLQQVISPILIPFIMGFSLMFTEKVLLLKYNNLSMLRICRILAALCFSLSFILPFINYNLAVYILFGVITIVCVMLAVFSISQMWAGKPYARLYGLGRITLLLSCILTGMLYIGMINLNMDIQTPVMLGLTVEVITMAAVLAIRYHDERKSKMKIQQQALEQAERLRESREESLRAEAEANERLEQMVQERTLELEITLRELNEVNQKLTEQTTTDSLTGVKNRAMFDRRLIAEGRISRRQQTPMALLMIDIDRFKNINDKHGHLAGDYAIKTIAHALSENLKRPTDLVSRFGGEEFAIILPNTDETGALQVAEVIRNAVDSFTIHWDNNDIPLTVSIGVSVAVIESDKHPTALLEHADKALYLAKRSGRNQVCMYQQETDENKIT